MARGELKRAVVDYKMENPDAHPKQISEALGISIQTVRGTLWYVGMCGSRARKLPPADELRVLLQTTPWSDIAARYGCSNAAVWYAARRIGIDRQPRHLDQRPQMKRAA